MSNKLPFTRAIAAIGGSAGMALTSLMLAICLMQKGSVEEYGLFAFLLVTQALANGVSNAILGAPLLIALNDNPTIRADRVISFMSVNLIICLIFAGIQSFFAFYYSGSTVVSLVYACSAFSTTLRWFGRSYCNNSHQHSKVVISDAVYSLLSLCGAVILFSVDMVSLESFGALTALVAIFATPLLGAEYLKKQFFNIFSSRLTGFFEGYKHQGKYALIGVLSTEATSNAHSYLVTLMLGPKAFAPLAAAMLLFRPVNVVYSSLIQIERPRLRQLVSNDKQHEAKKSLGRFFYFNLLSWLANLILVIVVLNFFGNIYWKDSSTFNILETSAFILALITFCRAFKIPMSVVIQAFDRFKSLSAITLKSCFVTLPLVYLSILYLEQSISLLGVLVGDMLALLLLIRLYFKGTAHNA